MYRAVGCEQGVQVNLVGFRALVTGRRTISRGPSVPSSLEAVPRAGDWPRGDAAAWWTSASVGSSKRERARECTHDPACGR